MALDEDFRAFLAADSDVQTHVGSSDSARIEPSILPEGVAYPAIVYQRISTNRRYSHSGDSGVPTVRMQVDCYAGDNEAFQLAADVRKALTAFSGTMNGLDVQATFVTDQDVRWEAEAEAYRVRQDYMITHDEVTA